MRYSQTFPLVLTSLFLGLTVPCVADDWLQARSENFLLIGNADERAICEVANQLEEFRATIQSLWSLAPELPFKPMVVFVFKDARSFQPFAPLDEQGHPLQVGGYLLDGEGISFICVSRMRDRRVDDLVFHEYVHYLLHWISPRLPPWLGEGLAEYYSTFRLIDRGRRALIGQIIPGHVSLLRHSALLPLSRLLEDESSAFLGQKQSNRHYVQAWLLVHYLLNAEAERFRPGFLRYLEDARQDDQGEIGRFRSALGLEDREVGKGLSAYLRHGLSRPKKLDLEDFSGSKRTCNSARISEPQLDAWLGRLLLESRRIEAETYLAQSLGADPSNGSALSALGILHFREHRFEEAKVELEGAVELADAPPLAHYYYVLSLLHRPSQGTVLSSDEVGKKLLIKAHLEQVVRMLPSHVDSQHLLARVNLLFKEDLDRSLQLAEQAVRLAPERKSYLLTLAEVQIWARDFAGARKSLNLFRRGNPDAGLLERAADIERAVEEAEGGEATAPLTP